MASSYSERLKDPHWQKKRLQILERDDWTCQLCFDSESTLVVHHRRYLTSVEPWDYPDELLVTLCEECHNEERALWENVDLLEILKGKFYASDVLAITKGFHCLELVHSHEVIASTLEWVLSTPAIQVELVGRFFQDLYKNVHPGDGK